MILGCYYKHLCRKDLDSLEGPKYCQARQLPTTIAAPGKSVRRGFICKAKAEPLSIALITSPCFFGAKDKAETAATLITVLAAAPRWPAALRLGIRLVCQREGRQRHAGEADAEFLQRRAACDGLGHVPGHFVEMVIHNLSFVLIFGFRLNTAVLRTGVYTCRTSDALIAKPTKALRSIAAPLAATVTIVSAGRKRGQTRFRVCLSLVRESEAGQRHACEANTKFLQCPAARDRLSQALCEFIEFVVHTIPLRTSYFSA
jgi:hypothetical protein